MAAPARSTSARSRCSCEKWHEIAIPGLAAFIFQAQFFGGGLRLRVDAFQRLGTDLRPRYVNLFNPVILFQNRFNSISETHYDDYEKYRGEIQALIDKQIRVMVHDNWNAVEVDKEKFQEYVEELSSL